MVGGDGGRGAVPLGRKRDVNVTRARAVNFHGQALSVCQRQADRLRFGREFERHVVAGRACGQHGGRLDGRHGSRRARRRDLAFLRGRLRLRRSLATLGVAGGRAAVEHGSARRAEGPVVASVMKRQEQHAEVVVVDRLHVRLRGAHFKQRLPAAADDELADAFAGGDLRGILRREALVHMVVAVEDDVGVRRVEGVPEGRHARAVADPSRAEARVVPVGEGALVGVSGEVALQPGDLSA